MNCCRDHKFRRNRGFSYVEIMLTGIIISILLVCTLKLFANLGRSRSAVTETDLAQRLALDLARDLKSLPYKDMVNSISNRIGIETGENLSNRTTLDDLDDYNNYTACPPRDKNNQIISEFSPLTCKIQVAYVTADAFTPCNNDQGFKKVTITIENNVKKVLAMHTYIMAELF